MKRNTDPTPAGQTPAIRSPRVDQLLPQYETAGEEMLALLGLTQAQSRNKAAGPTLREAGLA